MNEKEYEYSDMPFIAMGQVIMYSFTDYMQKRREKNQIQDDIEAVDATVSAGKDYEKRKIKVHLPFVDSLRKKRYETRKKIYNNKRAKALYKQSTAVLGGDYADYSNSEAQKQGEKAEYYSKQSQKMERKLQELKEIRQQHVDEKNLEPSVIAQPQIVGGMNVMGNGQDTAIPGVILGEDKKTQVEPQIVESPAAATDATEEYATVNETGWGEPIVTFGDHSIENDIPTPAEEKSDGMSSADEISPTEVQSTPTVETEEVVAPDKVKIEGTESVPGEPTTEEQIANGLTADDLTAQQEAIATDVNNILAAQKAAEPVVEPIMTEPVAVEKTNPAPTKEQDNVDIDKLIEDTLGEMTQSNQQFQVNIKNIMQELIGAVIGNVENVQAKSAATMGILHKQILSEREKNASLRETNREQSETIQAQETTISQLNNTVSGTKEENKNLKEENKNLTEKLFQQTASIQQKDAENNALKTQLNDQTAKFNNQVTLTQQKETENQRLTAHVKQLESDNAELELQLQEQKTINQNLQTEMGQMKEQFRQMQHMMQTFQEAMSQTFQNPFLSGMDMTSSPAVNKEERQYIK